MKLSHRSLVLLFTAISALLSTFSVYAGNTLVVAPDGIYMTIESALEDAQDSDIIEVHGGIYSAPLFVSKSVTVRGINQPIIDGNGTGSLVIITAPNVVFEGFTVRNTGGRMHHEDSGIVIQADGVSVRDNLVEDVLFGIYFADANNGLALNNTIIGREYDIALRGDGIRVWFSHNVRLEGNKIYNTRDTLIWYADGIEIIDNDFYKNRYGLHFMYSSEAKVIGNTFRNNHVGTYLMYSTDLEMRSNTFSHNYGPSGYGIALKDMDEVIVEDNWLIGNRAGLYIDNSPSRYEGVNYFVGNAFAYNDIGVTVQPNVQRNMFRDNSFIENLQQVSTRGRGTLQGNQWGENGRGNYWSDYVGYDSEGDGIGNLPYRSEKLFENMSDTYPQLRVFLFSPVAQAIELAAAAFPTLRPEPKMVDSYPLTTYTLPETDLAESVAGTSMDFAAILLWIVGCFLFFGFRLLDRVLWVERA